jgi:hypothetical protein
MKFSLSLLAAGAALTLSSVPALGLTDAGTLYTLSYSADIGSSLTTDEFIVTLQVDTTGYSPAGSFLEAVAVKVSSAADLVSVNSFSGSPGSWTSVVGNIGSSDSCTASGDGFMCAQGNGSAATGVDYTFMWDVTVNAGTLFVASRGEGTPSLQAAYRSATGELYKISVPLPPCTENCGPVPGIPEPGTYALMLAGLGVLGFIARRRGF